MARWNLTQFRLILTDTDELYQKIYEMSQRIRQLEDGLALLQSGISPEKHPLLQDELLSIKYGPKQRTSAEAESAEDPLADPVEAFGTLTIGDGGESRYFGASAGSEVCLTAIHLRMKLTLKLFATVRPCWHRYVACSNRHGTLLNGSVFRPNQNQTTALQARGPCQSF